jgi:ribosomal protein S10
MKIKPTYLLTIQSTNKNVLLSYKNFLISIFDKSCINYSIFLPTKKKKITLLKSPHVYKKAKEQFEVRYYKSVTSLSFEFSTKSLRCLFLNKPSSINLKIKQIVKF